MRRVEERANQRPVSRVEAELLVLPILVPQALPITEEQSEGTVGNPIPAGVNYGPRRRLAEHVSEFLFAPRNGLILGLRLPRNAPIPFLVNTYTQIRRSENSSLHTHVTPQ